MLPVDAEEHDGKRQRHHERQIAREDVVRKRRFAVGSRNKGRNARRQTHDRKRVEEVGSDNVPENELVLAAPCGRNRARQLRKRRPRRDNRQSNHQIAHAAEFRKVHRSPNEKMRRSDQHAQPHDQLHNWNEDILLFDFGFRLHLFFRLILGFLVVPAVERKDDEKCRKENDRLNARAGAVLQHDQRKKRDERKSWSCDESDGRLHDEREDERRHAKDNRNVKNATTIGVAQREVRMAGNAGHCRDAEFRCTRAEADDHHADDERRDAKRLGDRCRTVHKQVAGPRQRRESARHENQRKPKWNVRTHLKPQTSNVKPSQPSSSDCSERQPSRWRRRRSARRLPPSIPRHRAGCVPQAAD